MNEMLKANVIAENKANKVANMLRPKLKEYFRDKVGQKVVKKDGSLLQKIKDDLSNFSWFVNENNHIMIYFDKSEYSLRWSIKVNEMIEGKCACVYRESSVYVGNLRDGFLVDIDKHNDDLKVDYNVESILKLRECHKEAQQVADEIRSNLYPFGEYDR